MSFPTRDPSRPRRRTVASLLLSVSALLMHAYSAATAATLVIDSTVRHQTVEGFGAAIRSFDDPQLFSNSTAGRAATTMTTAQQNEVLDLLYDDLKLTRVRPASSNVTGAGIEPTNDNNNPYITDLSRFNFTGARFDSHLNSYAEARLHGADTLYLAPPSRELWMGAATSSDVEEYSEWLLSQVRRAKQMGSPLQYLSVTNDPVGDGNSMDGEFIRAVIKNLGPRMHNQGFDLPFVITADAKSSQTFVDSQAILSDPEALPYIGALATHLGNQSAAQVAQLKTIADQHHLPLWVADSSVDDLNTIESARGAIEWASQTHELLSTYDVSAVDYKWGFGGVSDSETSALITLNEAGDSYADYTLNKAYFAFGQYSRFVAPGAQRIDVQSTSNDVKSTSNDVKSTAFLSGTELVMVAINSSDSSQEVTFDLRGVTEDRFFRVRTSLTENWATLPVVDVEASTFTITLPPNSIETLTTDPAATAAGDFNENGVVDAGDLTAWSAGYGRSNEATHANGDANGDRVVDGTDLLLWQRDFSAVTGAPGDFDGAAGVNAADLAIWKTGYGMAHEATPRQGDADGDGDVDGSDFLLWQRNVISARVTASEAVPEPKPSIICILAYLLSSKRSRKRVGNTSPCPPDRNC